MEEDYSNLFNQLRRIEPPAGLGSAILTKISLLERRAHRSRLLWFGGLASASLAGMISVLVSLIAQLASSGFGQYLSLALSDGGTLTNYWREFTFSLLESLPLVGLATLLTLLGLLIWAVSQARQNWQFSNLSWQI